VGNRKEEKEAKTLVKGKEIKDNIYIISVFHFKNRSAEILLARC